MPIIYVDSDGVAQVPLTAEAWARAGRWPYHARIAIVFMADRERLSATTWEFVGNGELRNVDVGIRIRVRLHNNHRFIFV